MYQNELRDKTKYGGRHYENGELGAVGFVGEGGESGFSTFKTLITLNRVFKTFKHKQLLRERGGRAMSLSCAWHAPRGGGVAVAGELVVRFRAKRGQLKMV